MKLINIANKDRDIFLFTRDDQGKQIVYKDENFYPFFYEPDPTGTFVSYDGIKLKKVSVSRPQDMNFMRSSMSYSSDIKHTVNYVSHKIDKIEKSKYKYFFLDIEILADKLPDINNPIYPVSCITIYNSFSKEYKTFFLSDYNFSNIAQQEKALINDFIAYFKKEAPDMWLSWHVDFDYQYLHNRFPSLAKDISPISYGRSGRTYSRFGNKPINRLYFPAGISILDYLTMFKKVNMREGSLKLHDVAEKHLGFGKKYKNIKFNKLVDDIKYRNIEDVELMVKLEEKFRILEYFDEIRIFSKASWEDLTNNSMILDSILLSDAVKRKIVLPNKMYGDENSEQEELEGAYRRAERGLFFDLYKADVGSMYPNQIVNFCLDPANILNVEPKDAPQGTVVVNNEHVIKQDPTALIPALAIRLMNIKDSLKAQLKVAKLDGDETKILQMKYDAYKGLVNSLYGVTAFPAFRLYNYKTASCITFLARDLLHYVEDKMKEKNYEVVYTDTDALMYRASKDETDLLNSLVQDWGKKYGKESLNIKFEGEGKFTRILIKAKCHYYGYVENSKGVKKEIKGMEMKRSNSSKFESKFQESLIEQVLDKKSKREILRWIDEQKIAMKKIPILELAFPCKIANREYKTEPIFIRAVNNTKKIKSDFEVIVGDNFYYIFIKSLGVNEENSKDVNVLALTNDDNNFVDLEEVDWERMIERNIKSKSDEIFEAIGWKEEKKDMIVASLF